MNHIMQMINLFKTQAMNQYGQNFDPRTTASNMLGQNYNTPKEALDGMLQSGRISKEQYQMFVGMV